MTFSLHGGMKYCFTLMAFALLLAGCSPQAKRAELRVLCGDSMAAPAQSLADIFKTNRGVDVLMDLGGSETLLPRVLTGAPADVFICHDPFEQKVKDAGRWTGSARVGVLKPVLLVKPGNPLNIKSLSDLTNRTVKLGIGDPQYSTCGALFVELLDKKGIRNEVMKQVVLQGRKHAELANGLILGPLDAAVVWNYIARLYTNKVQLVPTTDAYAEINITMVGLKQSPNPELRDAFLEFCRSQQVQALFEKYGYGR